jgi:tetratricopeptide (TPR) repeat protein
LREELKPQGLEVVTVALDLADAAHESIEQAAPQHPALIDELHSVGGLFGIVNVPSGVWIDEDGIIVRPPEPAWPGKSMWREIVKIPETLPDDLDPFLRKALEQTAKIKTDPAKYLAALRDWVANGSESKYALTPEEVIGRSEGRSTETSEAAAHFEIGQYLQKGGHGDDAVEHYKRAHELQPDNWTYKRQAWNHISPLLQDARAVYGTGWADEVEKFGAENYYRPSDL